MGDKYMGLVCRTQKLSEDISYTVIRDRYNRNHFEVSVSIYDTVYETIKNSPSSVDRWIIQTIEDHIRQ